MLRRAIAGQDEAKIVARMGLSAELCAIKPQGTKTVWCFEDTEAVGAPVSRIDVRDDVTLKRANGSTLYTGPGVEVSVLQPYRKAANYPDQRPWIDIMFELLCFSFDRTVEMFPEAADLRPYAILPDAAAASAWGTRLQSFGSVQSEALDNGTLVYWGGAGRVRKLIGVLGG